MVEVQETAPPSTATNAAPPAPPTATPNDAISPDFLNSLLGSVDVDMNDPLIQAALAQLTGSALPEPPADDKDKGAQKRKHGDDGDGSNKDGGAS